MIVVAKMLDYPTVDWIDEGWYTLVDDENGTGTRKINIHQFVDSAIGTFGDEWFYKGDYVSLPIFTFGEILSALNGMADLPGDHIDIPVHSFLRQDLNVDLGTPHYADKYEYDIFKMSLTQLIATGLFNNSDIFNLMSAQDCPENYPNDTENLLLYLGTWNFKENPGDEPTKIMLGQRADLFLENCLNNGVYQKESMYKCSIYNPVYLGNHVTDEQYEEIENGTFRDLWLGAYWFINNVTWQIVDFDYYYNTGRTGHKVSKHHVVVMPVNGIYNFKMNDTATAEGGYLNSKLQSISMLGIESNLTEIFGSDHILEHEFLFSNAIDSNGYITGVAFVNCKVTIPNEKMMFGNNAINCPNEISEFETVQLSLMRLNKLTINCQYTYWLRDIKTATSFMTVSSDGNIYDYHSGNEYVWVRPVFSLCKTNA